MIFVLLIVIEHVEENIPVKEFRKETRKGNRPVFIVSVEGARQEDTCCCCFCCCCWFVDVVVVGFVDVVGSFVVVVGFVDVDVVVVVTRVVNCGGQGNTRHPPSRHTNWVHGWTVSRELSGCGLVMVYLRRVMAYYESRGS